MPPSLTFMPRYDNGDNKNPDNISWFDDDPYDDGDSKNPDNFSRFKDSPASSRDKEGYYNHLCFPDHPIFPIMELDDNAPPPPAANYQGIMGGPPPKNVPPPNMASHAGSSRSHLSSSQSSSSDSLHNNPPSQRSPPTNNIILRVSPAFGSATFGYIYLAETKLHHQTAISAYFDSVGREISIIPCPDFDTFISNLNLMYHDVMFISDLPRYIIPAGNWILQANQYNDFPNHDWLPTPPNLSSFNLSSQLASNSQASSQLSRNLLPQRNYHTRCRPDPNEINSSQHSSYFCHNPCTPVPTVFMGGNHGNLSSHGGMSLLTHRGSGLMGGGASVAGSRSLGGTAWAHPTLDIKSISTTRSSDPDFVPLVQPDISSAISVLEGSSLDPSVPSPIIPAPSSTPI